MSDRCGQKTASDTAVVPYYCTPSRNETWTLWPKWTDAGVTYKTSIDRPDRCRQSGQSRHIFEQRRDSMKPSYSSRRGGTSWKVTRTPGTTYRVAQLCVLVSLQVIYTAADAGANTASELRGNSEESRKHPRSTNPLALATHHLREKTQRNEGHNGQEIQHRCKTKQGLLSPEQGRQSLAQVHITWRCFCVSTLMCCLIPRPNRTPNMTPSAKKAPERMTAE